VKPAAADDLSFRFPAQPPDSWILREMNFSLNKGEVLGVMGPNGSGKTTLIRLLAGLLKPTLGTVSIFGKPAAELKARERARLVATVSQDSAAPFSFSCFEVVLMGRSPHQRGFGFDTPDDIQAAEEAMRLTNTLYLRDRPVSRISGGEKQRVLIARGLAQSPKLFLLDEPTTYLDLKYQRECFQLLCSLNKERGLTVIIISHEINLQAAYCHRMLLLKDGRIYAIGPPRECLTRENIEAVYDCEVVVDENPLSKTPRVSLKI
jgi:iron complex transport system ATP-binding protein